VSEVHGSPARSSGAPVARSPGWESAFVAASCIFLHLMVVQPAGFPLTIAPVAVFVLLALHFNGRISMGALVGWVVLLLLPFANVLGQPAATYVPFLRTFALWAFNVTMVWWCAHGRLAGPRDGVARGAFGGLCVVAGFSALQSGVAFLTGSTALYNPFRGLQYLHPYDSALHDAGVGALSRAQGFYLEPSFGALVMVTLCVVLLLAEYKTRASLFLVAGGLFFNRSFTGIVTFAILVAIHLGLSLGRRVGRLTKLVVAFGFIVIAAIVLRSVLVARLSELSIEGASAYYRLVSPLIVLRDVLLFHPLGVEMGQVEAFMAPYGLLQIGSEGNTLDNGLYVLIFYFGWIGAGAVLALAITIVAYLLAGRRAPALFWTFLFFSLVFSGAIFVPEYALLLMLVIYQYRAGRVGPPLAPGRPSALSLQPA
jgi:putative colanic acid polymerase